MSNTTTQTVSKNSTPRLLLKTTMNNTTFQSPIATASITLSSSPITTTGSFYLPPRQKVSKKGRFLHKHLRKPPSFDTYLNETEPVDLNKPHTYYARTQKRSSSVSSCSSSSSEDNSRYPDFTNDELMYAKRAVNGLPLHQPRTRRCSSTAVKFVRFANDFNDDVSSITSSSSSSCSADDWDLEEDEEEDFIFTTPITGRHDIGFRGRF